MKTKLFVLMVVLLVWAAAHGAVAAENNPDEKEWIQLFNGKDLNDWVPKITGYEVGENFGNTFRVEDGVFKISYDQYDKFGSRFGHIFHKQKFSHYIIAVEYRFVGEQAREAPNWALRNNGIMVHSQPPETMQKDQDFPISIEIQLLGGLGTGERTTANLCTPGTNVVMEGRLVTEHCVSSRSKTYHGDQWVRVEAMVLGSSTVRHIVEGEVVLSYELPQIGGGNVSKHNPWLTQDGKLLSEGYIALQAESHPTEFRKVELLNLAGCMDPKAKNYKSYFVKAENWKCRY